MVKYCQRFSSNFEGRCICMGLELSSFLWTVSGVLNPIMILMMILYLSTVKGTYYRYVFISCYVVMLLIQLCCSLALIVLSIRAGNTKDGLIAVICSVLGMYILRMIANSDDDNWFKGQSRKIKQGLRRLRASLLSRPSTAIM